MAARTRSSRTNAGSSTDLPSAKLGTPQLISVGALHGFRSLRDLATTVLVKRQESDAAFAQFGFDARWDQRVHALLEELDVQSAETQARADEALPSAEALQAAKTAMKEWRRQAVTVVAVSVTSAASGAPGHLATGSSVAALQSSAQKLISRIPLTAVTPAGTGAQMRARGKALIKTLVAADGDHRAAVAKLSPAAKQMHARKGLLYEELKRLARVARHVTPNDAHAFAVSARTRGTRRGRPTSTGNGAPSASPPTA